MEADRREESKSLIEEEGKIMCSKITLKLRKEERNVNSPKPESLAKTS